MTNVRGSRLISGLFLFFLLFGSGVISDLPEAQTAPICTGPVGGRQGQCAADFELKSLDGKTFRLSDYRGKVVFLNFWATWCEPCIAEIPAMLEVDRQMRNQDFQILAVSIDTEGKKAIEAFYQKHFPNRRISYPTLLDQNKAVSGKYGTFKVPETYILDKTGKIRDKVEGIRDWSDTLIIHYLELLAKD